MLLFSAALLTTVASAQGQSFDCYEDLGPSFPTPSNVNILRPGDIKVVGAIGDSITAGFLANSQTLLPIIEWRGFSWSSGDEVPLTTTVTLPSILHGFSQSSSVPYGGATGNGGANSANAVFNQAISGAKAPDMPSQAETLITKMQSDPNVNFLNDWKVVTIWIGGNDLCAVCNNPILYSPENYIAHLTDTLRILQAGMPRTFVNLVSILNVAQLRTVEGTGCSVQEPRSVCPCATAADEPFVIQMQEAYNKNMEALAMDPRWVSDDFAVVYQPFYEQVTVPLDANGNPDRSYFAPDCFHYSPKAHSAAGVGLWNNMMQPVGTKELSWTPGEDLICPTAQEPFLWTNQNSKAYMANYTFKNYTLAVKR